MADYCVDTFRMVEDNEDSFRMWQGLVGPTYVPIMSNDGTLRWTNNGGLPNPSEVNLMGPQGAGIRIVGIRATAEELPATAPSGDIWLVGEGSPYEGYSFTGGEWIDLGPLTVGPAGPPGPQGDDYELTEADKQEIAELAEAVLLTELDTDPLEIRYGGTGAHDLTGAKENLGIDEIEDKLGTWPLGTDAQDVAGAINEMIGEIALQVADIEQLKDNFAGEFSPTSTYAVGAYVVYGGAFWRCHTAVSTAGSWTGASNWTQVTAGGELIGKVNKAGDTMTGNLTIQNTAPGEYAKNTAMDVTDDSYSATNSIGFRCTDKNGQNVAIYTDRYMADGSTGAWITGWKRVSGSNILNALGLYVDKYGNLVVAVTDPIPWRKALDLGNNGAFPITIEQGGTNATDAGTARNNIGLCYVANDTMSVTSSFVLNGLVGNSNATTVYLDVVTEKSMENISTITVTALSGYIAGISGRSTTGTVDYTGTGYTVSCTKQGTHHVRIGITKTSAFDNLTAYTPVTYFGTLTLKFT